MSRVDLHIHSTYSADGQYSPGELIQMARRENLEILSLTDHNSSRGCREMAGLAAQAGMKFISGIELDCRFQGTWLHVLGYGIDPDFPGFLQLEEDIIRQERANADGKIKAFENMGFGIDRAQLSRLSYKGIVWGEMIGEVILADERNARHQALEPYRPGGARSDNPMVNFDWDFCSPGQAAHFRVEFIELDEALSLIRQAGGRPVLAHPGRDVKENPDLLKAIAERGLWGLEAFSSYHTPSQTAFYRYWGTKLGLVLTCGSDLHGKTKPAIRLGSVACGPVENYETGPPVLAGEESVSPFRQLIQAINSLIALTCVSEEGEAAI